MERQSSRGERTRSVPPGFLMMLMDSRLVLPRRRMTASTASAAKWSLSCVRILLLSVVRAMFSRSCARSRHDIEDHTDHPGLRQRRKVALVMLQDLAAQRRARDVQQVLRAQDFLWGYAICSGGRAFMIAQIVLG